MSAEHATPLLDRVRTPQELRALDDEWATDDALNGLVVRMPQSQH